MYKITSKIIKFLTEALKNWKVELTAGGKILAVVKMLRGRFQEGALLPLLLIIAMVPLNYILRKCTTKSQEKINHLMYIDNIKLVKKEKELKALIQAIRIYRQDIEMELGIKKYGMLIIKSGKGEITEGIEPPNQERIRTLGEKENYKYLGILETDNYQTSRDERKN